MAAAVALVLAFAAFFLKADEAWDGLRFRLGIFNREASVTEVKETVTVFNNYYARLFSTAGEMDGLNLFPADNLIKRRVIQEIDIWRGQGKALVYDKYRVDVKSVEMLGARRGVALTEEKWALLLRETATGRKSPGSKTLQCRCRYLLGKVDDQWKVLEYDVYSMNDQLPPVPESWKR